MRRVAVVVGVAMVLAACGGSGSSSLPPTNPPTGAPNLITGPPPWPAPTVGVSALAAAAGLPMLPQEALNEHIHAHLDVYFDGQAVTVPADTGIDLVARAISPLHTHDTTGVVHIESPVKKDYFLGQFFTECGVQMANGCVAGFCPPAKMISVVVNGTPVPTAPEKLVLHAHDEIALVIGTPPATIPSSYAFPPGY